MGPLPQTAPWLALGIGLVPDDLVAKAWVDRRHSCRSKVRLVKQVENS